MKKAAPPPDSKVVWIVGAGASVSESKGHFPSLLGIPQKARETGALDDDSDSDKGITQLAKYLKSRFYGDLRNPREVINLEHVLSPLEIDIAVTGEPSLLLARKYVLRLLRLTLLRLHKSMPDGEGQYKRLVDTLGPRDTIISFNWDYLLDEAFGRSSRLEGLGGVTASSPRCGTPPNRYDDFLLTQTGWGEQSISGLGPPNPVHNLEDRGRFIKAHGSIDWYYCTNPGCRSHHSVFPLLAAANRPKCSGCGERAEMLIVPPTMNKRLRDVPLTRRLWTLAAMEMQHANEVDIWGYSLPPTDFFSDWLLRHARSSRCKRLVLINPEVCVDSETLNIPFIRRFVRALRAPGSPIALELYTSYDKYESQTSAAQTKAMKEQLRLLSRGEDVQNDKE